MLVSLSDLKTSIGETTTDYDTFLTAQINLFSSAIENYCSRKFEQDTYTQTFYFSDFTEDDDLKKLWLYHFPVSSVSEVREVTTFNNVDTETVIASNRYRLRGDQGKLLKTEDGYPANWFNESRYFLVSGINSRIEVDYTAGYSTVPLEIQDVVTSLVEERYLKKKAGIQVNFGNDVQSINIPGTMSISFDYTLQPNERKTKFGMLLGNYINILDFFRSERALIGEIKESYVVES